MVICRGKKKKKEETKKKNRRLLRPPLPLVESTRSAEPPKLLALHTPPFTSIIPHTTGSCFTLGNSPDSIDTNFCPGRFIAMAESSESGPIARATKPVSEALLNEKV